MPDVLIPAPTCACGHDRYHPDVRRKVTYGFGEWLFLFSGGTAIPKEIAFSCPTCQTTFEVTRDRAILKAFKGK